MAMTAQAKPYEAGNSNSSSLTEVPTCAAAKEFHTWRNTHSIQDIKNTARAEQTRPTVAILSSGGCIDLIAAVKASFKPIWSTEINKSQQLMWEDLTGTVCYGDTFKQDYSKIQSPDYLTSGQPCIDYANSGSCDGDEGETGWMFTEQTTIILQLQPKAFRLEISDNAINVHDGREVMEVVNTLKQQYVVKAAVIPVWHYGDCTSRKRLFIVGFHKDLGPTANAFQFPEPTHNADTLIKFRDIAITDDQVPEEYWRSDSPTRVPWREPVRTCTHKIASTGDTMGHSSNPNAILSWEALGNTQTTYNGGARRPRLDWTVTKNGPVGNTRLTAPIETVRAAALPDDYLQWCQSFQDDDRFLQTCVNNGTPNRTSYAIDKQIHDILQHTGDITACIAVGNNRKKRLRSTMLDTGCNLRLHNNDIEPAVKRMKPSNYDIKVANNQTIKGANDGILTMDVVNTEEQEGLPDRTQITVPVTTTSQPISRELFTIDDFYRQGYSILLRNANYQGGITELYKPAQGGAPEIRIPVRYDYDRSGFWLDYTIPTEHSDSDLHYSYTGDLHYSYTGEQTLAITEAAQEHDGVTSIQYGPDTRDYNILGAKTGLRPNKAQLTKKESHEEYGHLGYHPDCKICKRVLGCMRRLKKIIDKFREQRRAHTWVMDTVTWSKRDMDGSKYMVVLRDKASSVFKIFCIYYKYDIRQELREWIEQIRADPAFYNLDYLPVTIIETDRAGEWGLDCKEWNELQKDMRFKTIYKPSDRKEESGTAERACGVAEVVVKSILMQQNLPPHWWVRAARQAEWLLNRFSTSVTAALTPPDGDAPRPLEVITANFYSRRQIDRELSYYLPIGTPALVHDTKVKGSSIKPKSAWGISVGMYREAVIFWMPTTNHLRQSKSFTAYKLRQGLNYAQFLNLPAIPTTQLSTAIPDDFKEQVVVELPETIERVSQQEAPIQLIKHTGNTTLPITYIQPSTQELGGSVIVTNADKEQLKTNTDTGYLESAHPDDPAPTLKAIVDTAEPKRERHPKLCTGSVNHTPIVCIRNTTEVQQLWDDLDTQRYLKTAVVTRGTDTFKAICKHHKIPQEHHEMYRDWLTQTQSNSAGGKLTHDQLPTGRGERLPPHLKLPQPYGSQWRALKIKRLHTTHESDAAHKRATRRAVNTITARLQQTKHAFKATGILNLDIEQSAHAGKAKKKRQSHSDEPANTYEALEHPVRGKQWSGSMDEEMNGLTKMGVLDHGYTLQDLHDMGITAPPVPLGLYHTHKTDKQGEVNRLKTRAAVKGHRGNMKKGVHYTETFAPTPSEDTARILQCLIIIMNLTRMCGDIEKAYCWAKVPPGELIALSYPEGYCRTNEQGEELYMIMRKNLYGHPAAARAWTKERDTQLLNHFNCEGWTCKQSRMDPCLFTFTDQKGKRAWMLIHTDDCDGAGEDQEIMQAIFNKINDIWKVKLTDPEYMLGVSRKMTYTDNRVTSIELTMTPFIEAMERSFSEHLKPGAAHTPFLENTRISKLEEVDSEEIKQVLQLGYQRAVGMLLWAARHSYPECKYGVSRLCSVMAKPTYRAFRAAMHMITYLVQNKHRGIRFNLEGNKSPIAHSDASNKPDPADGLAQAGFVVSWLGGPIATQSKKLKHVGLSSEHNEYMGITAAVKRIIWLRQLLEEIVGTALEALQHPTIIFGDNTQANRLCREHFISPGNQYIYQTYHYNKEAVELGFVEIQWEHTSMNIADLFTKPVSRQVLQTLLGLLTGYHHPSLGQ